IGFSGRRRGENKEEAKYVNTSDTPVYKKSQNLFGLNFAKAHCSESLILVEGNLDVISLHQAGFKNTVCPLGTAFTPEQATLITRYTNEVYICFDSDEAGQKAIDKAIGIFANTGINVKVALLPEGKDPDEFIKKNSPAKFQKLLDEAVSGTEYKLLRAGGGIDTEADNAKIKYLNSAAEILANTTDPIEVDYYTTKLSKQYGISKDSIRLKVEELKKKKVVREERKTVAAMANPKVDRNDVNPERRGHERAVKAEETIISILMKHADMVKFTKENISVDDFVTSLNKRLLDDLFKMNEANIDFDFSVIADSYSDKEIGYVAQLLNSGFNDNNPKVALAECFKALKTDKILNDKPESDDWAAHLSKIIENKKGN
ncbi:MAG: toprim domain-containing protein, partial [Clostridia bacterium]|nr:toprim domain-containing protein [Clostridia bacterium]